MYPTRCVSFCWGRGLQLREGEVVHGELHPERLRGIDNFSQTQRRRLFAFDVVVPGGRRSDGGRPGSVVMMEELLVRLPRVHAHVSLRPPEKARLTTATRVK